MEGRNGVKFGYLAIIIAIPTTVIKLISLVFSVWDGWVSIDYGLHFGFILVSFILVIAFSLIFIGMLTFYTIQTLRKPNFIEEQYKYPGWGIIIGLSLCIPIVIGFTFQGQFMYGDVITSSLFFLIGILFVISGIVMVQEVNAGTEQIQME